MQDVECTSFLQWALPRLRMRWAGFRKVRRQVCKRIGRRLRELDLADLAAYRIYLDAHPAEWGHLDSLCRITISRFYRDQQVWRDLATEVLPGLAQVARAAGAANLNCWSVGCASGEEPYTLALVWDRELAARYPDLTLHILASDSNAQLLARAEKATYPATALKELPLIWRQEMFNRCGRSWQLAARYREKVDFQQHDIRIDPIQGRYSLILCRNLVFTYFASELQCLLLKRLTAVLPTGGVIVVGGHERMPPSTPGFRVKRGKPCFWQKTAQEGDAVAG